MLAQQYKCLTNNAVEQLHSAMQSCPAPDREARDPDTLRTPLMPHQRRALAWALWRETQVPSGGILGTCSVCCGMVYCMWRVVS